MSASSSVNTPVCWQRIETLPDSMADGPEIPLWFAPGFVVISTPSAHPNATHWALPLAEPDDADETYSKWLKSAKAKGGAEADAATELEP